MDHRIQDRMHKRWARRQAQESTETTAEKVGRMVEPGMMNPAEYEQFVQDQQQNTNIIIDPNQLFLKVYEMDDIVKKCRDMIRRGPPPKGAKVKPNLLLIGPKGTGKSTISDEFLKLPNSISIHPKVTPSGLITVLDENPHLEWVVWEELGEAFKRHSEIEGIVRTWAASGWVVDLTGNKGHRPFHSRAVIVGSTNSLKHFTEPMLDRFFVEETKSYTQDQFNRIVISNLRDSYSMDRELATYIAKRAWDYNGQARITEQVAYLYRTFEDVSNEFDRLESRKADRKADYN